MLSGLSNLASAATSKVNQLTSVAKGVLCLPSIISGLPDTLAAIGSGIVAGIAAAAAAAVDNVLSIVTGAIEAQIAKVTGAINSVLSAVNGAIAAIAGAIDLVRSTIQNIKDQVSDIFDFIKDSENCNFAAASLLSCITSQALNSLTPNLLIDISKGVSSIDKVGNQLASAISSPAGAIGNVMNKANSEIQRATSVINAVKIF